MSGSHVVLVGGAPGSGKTTLAKALAADLGWAWLSGDDLAIAARALISPAARPDLHPMTPQGSTVYFTNGPPSRLIDDAVVLSDALWPAFRRVINAHSGADCVVIDWWLFSPRRIRAEALEGVSSIWLHVDPEVLWQRERSNHDFFAASHDPGAMLENFMHRSLWRNDLVEQEATAAGLPIVNQPGDRDVVDLVHEARNTLMIH